MNVAEPIGGQQIKNCQNSQGDHTGKREEADEDELVGLLQGAVFGCRWGG
jgi:hypothetical protein